MRKWTRAARAEHIGSSGRRTWIACPLVGKDTDSVLRLAHQVQPWVDAVELRLDQIERPDLPRLLAESPLPTIVTLRPVREGGRYCGAEERRLALLREAAALGAIAVDVEWDAADAVGDVSPALRIVSHHIFDHTPPDLENLYAQLLARRPDVVKIASFANTLEDALRVCLLLDQASCPTIAIAMGEVGLITRLIAPAFPHAFVTYAAADENYVVAPGQVTVREMHERFHVHRIRPGTRVYGLLAPDANRSPRIREVNERWHREGRNAVLLPLQLTARDDRSRVHTLCERLGITLFSA